MEKRSVLQRLRDARGFARKAHELIGGMPLSMLKSVEYHEHAARSYLIIVGEALNRLPPETKEANPTSHGMQSAACATGLSTRTGASISTSSNVRSPRTCPSWYRS